jgi:HEAT repeat protein
VRAAAIVSLGRFGDWEGSAETLVDALEDDRSEVRHAAARVLAKAPIAPRAGELLIGAVALRRHGAGGPALRALVARTSRLSPSLIPEVLDLVLTSPNEPVRFGLGTLLAESSEGDEAVVRRLADAVGSPRPRVRRRAIEALTLFATGARSAVLPVRRALVDPSRRVRAEACRAVGAMGEGGRSALPALARRRFEGESSVVSAANNAFSILLRTTGGELAALLGAPAKSAEELLGVLLERGAWTSAQRARFLDICVSRRAFWDRIALARGAEAPFVSPVEPTADASRDDEPRQASRLAASAAAFADAQRNRAARRAIQREHAFYLATLIGWLLETEPEGASPHHQ